MRFNKIAWAFLFSLVACLSALATDNTTAEKEGKLRAENATQARLGVSVMPVPEALACQLPDMLSNELGILVSDVIAGSPADKAGLKKFDILIRYGGQDLYSPEQFVKQVRNDKPGSTVELQCVHRGKIQTVEVKLGEEKSQETENSPWPKFGSTFKFPWAAQMPNFWRSTQDQSKVRTEWTKFESLSMSKKADGSYSVRIAYKDSNDKSIEREFKGNRDEILAAIASDSDLPESCKIQLTRTLYDCSGTSPMESEHPFGFNWNHPLFQWPNLDF